MSAYEVDRLGHEGVVPPGLPDELFVRGDTPMTKAEVRAVTMSTARLRPGHRVLDVGAGTGSLSIEAALLCAPGEVVAVERDEAALELLNQNLQRFGIENVTVVNGEAPEALSAGLVSLATASRDVTCPQPFDCILVGGSGGKMPDLLEALPGLLHAGGRVVFNTICLETTAMAAAALRRPPWTGFTCSQVAVSRGVRTGPLLRFEALNPVYVTSAELGEDAVSAASAEAMLGGAEMRGAAAAPAVISGVGVGPGDPGLLTVSAVEMLQHAGAVMAPAPRKGAESLALSIAQTHLPPGCPVVTAHFPMTEDRATLIAAWDHAAERLLKLAEESPPVAFITLGDALLYSTWSYVLAALHRADPAVTVATIPGITAMAACAALAGRPLAEGRDPLLVWPDAPPEDAAALLEIAPNIVFMKAGKHLDALADLADKSGAEALAVRRASRADAASTADLRAWAGGSEYFTTVLLHREDTP